MDPSVVGRTTLLRTIVGLCEPMSGGVERPRGSVPFVFQDPGLLPWGTVRRNVELVLGDDASTRAAQWLEKGETLMMDGSPRGS